MSCYHCYTKTARNDDLIDKIIEHGEHLKSSMIETILKNQPIATTATRSNQIYSNRKQLEQIQMYLRGDPMNKDDELQVLDTLRSISVIELSKITDQTYTNRSDNSCDNTTTYQQIKTINYLQYIDCMKISINSIKLNDIGNKKVCVDKLTNLTQTFFIEYRIPAILIRHTNKLKPKVDSGLDSSNIVRLCARRSCDQEIIIFKHSTIHDIVNNLNRLDLDEIQIKFKISYRNFRQKHPEILGYAIFSFNSFKNQTNLCYNQDLTINCDDNQLINVGKLKISIQLGCERLYFGKEVLEVINENLDNCNDNKNDDRDEIFNKIDTAKVLPHNKIEIKPNPIELSTRIDENSILFCLIYVQEARFDRHISNSFINCCMFARELYFSSKLYESGSNPIYNFYQQVPLIYNEDLLMKLRDNYLIVEFLEKSGNQKDFLIGLAKLSLHSFYLTFRNSVIVDYLKNKHLPVISTDGWETICNPFNDRIIGEASILLALGTKEQIDNLLSERGLKRNVVKCKLQDRSIQVDKVSKNYRLKSIGVQSDMEHKDIGSLLNQLINAQRQRNVENPSTTNTDVVDHQPQLQQQPQQEQQQPELRRTSDLLDTLHKALSLDKDVDNNCKKIEKKTFKCQILIDSALHLPSRKKCKSKKSKNQKSNKHNDDILPSTYVTFEITTNNIRITPIITKCTNPKWDYRCDVVLPIEYLTNKQKRLIFKVWRKSTNTTMTPNLQTDFIIGFATVDLTVLLAGLPTIQGWYNIVDFSNKCHGQINIHITPLENISRYQQQQPVEPPQETSTNCNPITEPIEKQIDNESDNTDCNELLSRTLKRKFIELDEITQRLRLRLSKVTNDPDTDDTETLSNDDELIDEFEHDINTLCVEDDFDMVDFEKEAKHFNDNHLKEIGLLQQTVQSNNQPKIDNLVENLSINDTSATTTSRYISGCSNTETMLDQLEQNSRPNLYTNESFSRAMVEKFNWPSDSNSSSSSESINNGKQ